MEDHGENKYKRVCVYIIQNKSKYNLLGAYKCTKWFFETSVCLCL